MDDGAANGSFYEATRRNVAILLIFWLSYILAYGLCAMILVRGSGGGRDSTDKMMVGYSGKRRSNLSRLVLLQGLGRSLSATEERPRSQSLPPPPSSSPRSASSASSTSWAPSVTDLSESEVASAMSDTEARSRSRARSRSHVSQLGSHLLSAFVPEYTTAVVSLAVSLQGFFLIPASLAALRLLLREGGGKGTVAWSLQWQWISLAFLQGWWASLWRVGLSLLLMALPVALIMMEGREYRDAPVLRKLIIISARIPRHLGMFGLGVRPMILLLGSSLLFYLGAILTGLLEPLRWGEWIDFVEIFYTGIFGAASVVCLPLGLSTCLKGIHVKLTTPPRAHLLARRREELIALISSLESSAMGPNGVPAIPTASVSDGLVSSTTPVSKKSLRSKVNELRAQVKQLEEEIVLANRHSLVRSRLGPHLLCLLGALWLYGLVGRLIVGLVRFLASEFLWYLPGVRTIDWLLFKMASMVRLVEMVPTRPDHIHSLDWVASLSSLTFISLYATGLQRLTQRRRRPPLLHHSASARGNKESAALLHSAHLAQSQVASWPKYRLDRFLTFAVVLVTSSLVGSILVPLCGLVDDGRGGEALGSQGSDNHHRQQCHQHYHHDGGIPRLVPYASVLLSLLPANYQNLLCTLHSMTILRFPLLQWLILIYRSLLSLPLLLVAIRSLHPIYQSVLLAWSRQWWWYPGRWRQRPTSHLHIE